MLSCSFEYGKWQWGSCQADLICNFPRLPILKSFRQSLAIMVFVFNQVQQQALDKACWESGLGSSLGEVPGSDDSCVVCGASHRTDS